MSSVTTQYARRAELSTLVSESGPILWNIQISAIKKLLEKTNLVTAFFTTGMSQSFKTLICVYRVADNSLLVWEHKLFVTISIGSGSPSEKLSA